MYIYLDFLLPKSEHVWALFLSLYSIISPILLHLNSICKPHNMFVYSHKNYKQSFKGWFINVVIENI